MFPLNFSGVGLSFSFIFFKNIQKENVNIFHNKICSSLIKYLCFFVDSKFKNGKDQKNPGQDFPDHFRIEPNVCGLKVHTLS
jgi:hypothetical protein